MVPRKHCSGEVHVHGHLSSLVDERLIFLALERSVSSSDDESLVSFKPAYNKNVELGSIRADVANMVRHRSSIDLLLNSYGKLRHIEGDVSISLLKYKVVCFVRLQGLSHFMGHDGAYELTSTELTDLSYELSSGRDPAFLVSSEVEMF